MRRAAWAATLAAAAWLTTALGCGSGPVAAGASGINSAAPAGCIAPTLGATTLYLRGSMNQWQPVDEGEFVYRCNAYYLNIGFSGEHQFKIADDRWSDASVFAKHPGSSASGLPALLSQGPASANLQARFDGPQTLRLAFEPAGPRLSLQAGHFDDPRQKPVTDPVALSLRHDSRAPPDKQPFGAVPAGTDVQFSLTALPGVQQATLVIERRLLEGDQTVLAYQPLQRIPLPPSAAATGDAPGRQRYSARHRFDTVGVYGYWFEVQIAGQAYALQNNAHTIPWTREKGSNGLADVARLPDALHKVRRLRLSVYQPGLQVPDWAQGAVYYNVFPERFRNGDKANDPRPGQQRYQRHGIEAHARWLGTPYKPGSGDGSDAVYNNDFFGGDLAGLIDKLDYIRSLGATAIYLTPVFAAASNHKYDTADYRRIDPAFGSNADFSRLAQAAAQRGLRVVPDASFNHTGSDSVYFDRFGNHSGGGNVGAFANGRIRTDSPWAGWYRFKPTEADPERQYSGWAGVADLPELDKTSPAWRSFAYRAPDSVTRQWLKAGAAGWRMDVAPWVPDDFWREWRQVVKQTDPQAITIAETWFDASKHLLGDMFDSTMNYIFRSAVLDYANGGPAQALVPPLELLREAYPEPAQHALMNLLSSHDVPRALHVLGDASPGGAAVAPAAVALARQRLRLALLLQVAYPGAPAVYYGDEVGVTGGDDPYNRAPYPWADEGGQPDNALLADTRRLLALRQAHAVLRKGTPLAPLHADGPLLVLARKLSGPAPAQWSVSGFNNSDQAQRLRVALPVELAGARFVDALGGGAQAVEADHLLLDLPARFGAVWVSQ